MGITHTKWCVAGSLALALLIVPLTLWAQPLIRHDLQVVLQPDRHRLQVTDTITLPGSREHTWHFRLHASLLPTSPTQGVRLTQRQDTLRTDATSAPYAWYMVTLPPGQRTFVLQYAGTMAHPIHQEGAEYARSFRDTPGTIVPEGVYLSAATSWYAHADDELVTFSLDVRLPSTWEVVSQGKRTRHERHTDATLVRWESPEPQEQIYLVGGPLTEYSRQVGPIQAMALLRTPDAQLAATYLDVTGPYLTMYNDLIGPYPYTKFVLVENFWETGYGMPSFTLLGSKVIRFPFILHSSYPHEILHNWWGNSVFIDATSGNWSEGLTAYLADHLVQEQRGTAVTYRRTALQKFTDYVATQRDIPLTAFRARHDAVTLAVGYDKALMVFHMLRQAVGDAAFVRALQTFYREYRFQRAGFADLQRVFTEATGTDMQAVFEQWITRPGAPELRVGKTTTRTEGSDYVLAMTLEQVQTGPAYHVQVPLAVSLEGQERAYQTTVVMTDKRLELTLRLPALPLRLDVDPQFDVLRRLHHREIPPAFTQMFGADRVLVVLPTAASEPMRQAYQQLAHAWQQTSTRQFEVRWDDDLDVLPVDRAVWLFGWNNRWRPSMNAAVSEYDITVNPSDVRVDQTILQQDTHTVVVTGRHGAHAQHTLAWIATDNPAALPGLGRKLPHYGKYSYLGFTGDEPVNVLKGQWPVMQSPMSVWLPQADGRMVQVKSAKLVPRQALASLPEVFSAERMLQDIRWLASPEMRGRGFGTQELDHVADFLATQFHQAGLQPAGDQAEGYLQRWSARGGNPEREVRLQNVVGIIPGSKPEWAAQSVVLGAHYDHLGLGWPEAHYQDVGTIHPGADDNASGVAVLLELARTLGKTWRPERTVVFVAFSGEEAGRLGSQHYVTHVARFPVAQSIGMLNLDGVGRLGTHHLLILGAASAREWRHIFRGAGYVTGVPITVVADDWGGSDHKSFLDAGVPAVQVFSGVHGDYHRPTDTMDKIDAQGLVKIAAVVREALVYLASRATPLTSTLGPDHRAGSPPLRGSVSARKVSLGTVPDFAYAGPGYRIADVTPDSPAAQAGLRTGDIIVRFGATPITDLRAFATALHTLQPGDRIAITFRRDEAEHTVHAHVVLR